MPEFYFVDDSGEHHVNYEIAGYDGVDGFHYDVENGDPLPTDADLELGGSVVVSIEDADGVSHYYTILGGLTDDYDLEDAISDLYDSYSGELA